MKAIAIIPTYNERENIPKLVQRLLALPLDLDLFFIDDASPDHTGQLLDSMQARGPRLRVSHRCKKLGLGTAYRQAFHMLLSEPYDRYIAMDADLSHPPESIPTLLDATEHADLAIGSRYVAHGGTVHCAAHRKLLSRTANHLSRLALGLTVRDATSGFRCYRRELLSTLDQIAMRSNGYSFQIEVTYVTQALGYRIREVPIIFHDRVHDHSKLGTCEVLAGAQTLLRL
ncbi:MAG TPA: polyprenol monophosphomannose synthase, partial [Nitrospira sp.]|nr:polyprenol monophosphomannose synthase [Nitrospira sp.]